MTELEKSLADIRLEEIIRKAVVPLQEEVKRLSALLERDKAIWVNPDEACRILGFEPVRSGSHRRRLKWLRTKGFLKKFREGRPILYDRKEVEAISQKIQANRIFLPLTL